MSASSSSERQRNLKSTLGFDRYHGTGTSTAGTRRYQYLKRAGTSRILYMKSMSGAEATGRGRGNCLKRFPTKPGRSGWGAEDISCSQPIQCLRLSRWGGAKRVCMRLHMCENILSGFGATTYSSVSSRQFYRSVTSGWANH